MTDRRQIEVEACCASVYRKTLELYDRISPKMCNHKYGYKILYGPPKLDAPILFIGYQPAGGASDADAGEKSGERDGWPEKLEYLSAEWRLAKKIRAVWKPDLLQNCVGMNSIFFDRQTRKCGERFPVKSNRNRKFFVISIVV